MLTTESLLRGYRRGYFPMALGRHWAGPLAWFNPEQRGIIPLEAVHVPRRLRERVVSGRFVVTADEDFAGVIRGCAQARPGEEETWINAEIIRAYTALHEEGHAHSVEAWVVDEGRPRGLVGGIYGVHIGGAFFAESKFCRPELGGTDASKVCLAHLMAHLRQRGFALLDVQYWTEHLGQFGCREISREAYRRQLEVAIGAEASWAPFQPGANIEHVRRIRR
jgi:leucyl/phenylalanyl-tRNA---protein transferase